MSCLSCRALSETAYSQDVRLRRAEERADEGPEGGWLAFKRAPVAPISRVPEGRGKSLRSLVPGMRRWFPGAKTRAWIRRSWISRTAFPQSLGLRIPRGTGTMPPGPLAKSEGMNPNAGSKLQGDRTDPRRRAGERARHRRGPAKRRKTIPEERGRGKLKRVRAGPRRRFRTVVPNSRIEKILEKGERSALRARFRRRDP